MGVEVSVADLFKPLSSEKDIRFIIAESQMLADEAEFEDMRLHVRNDVRRFHSFIELHKAQYDSSQSNKTWLIMIACFLVVTQLDKVIAFAKLFL